MPYNYDPPEPPSMCEHGEELQYFCEKCDDEIDYDTISESRKEQESEDNK